MARDVTYDRPMKATLYVHLDNGDMWEAGSEDFKRFGLDSTLDVYMRFDDKLSAVLREAGLIERDVTESELNIVRYLVETAVNHPDLIDHDDHNGWAEVAEVERCLQDNRRAVEDGA